MLNGVKALVTAQQRLYFFDQILSESRCVSRLLAMLNRGEASDRVPDNRCMPPTRFFEALLSIV